MDSIDEATTVKLGSETWYSVLGISNNATDKQITTAYKTLIVKYHPDRNPGNAAAAESYKAVNDAYKVLSDIRQRQQYDESIGSDNASSSSNTATAGSDEEGRHPVRGVDPFAPIVGRFVGVYSNIMSRLSTESTGISAEVTDTAYSLCKSGVLEGGGAPLDSRISDLAWGWAAEGRVDRHAAVYYRLNIDSRQVENGFIVHCRSLNKDRFKLVIFDREGQPLYTEDSLLRKENKSTNYTCATFFFTIFDAYRLPDNANGGGVQLQAADSIPLPQVLSKLDSFTGCKRTIAPGQYLLCVYGENLLTKSTFNIVAVPAKNDAREVLELEEVDEALVECKMAMETLKAEYIHIKTQYDAVLNKIKLENDKADMLIQAREKSYMGFFAASIEAYMPTDSSPSPSSVPTAAPPASSSSAAVDGNGGSDESRSASDAALSTPSSTSPSAPSTTSALPAVLQGFSSAVANGSVAAINTATSVSSTAAGTATAAGGWLARRLSGIQTIVQNSMIHKSSSDAAGEEAGTADSFVEASHADSEGLKNASLPSDLPSSAVVPADTFDEDDEEGEEEVEAAVEDSPVPPSKQIAVETEADVLSATESVTRPNIKSKKREEVEN